MNENFRRLLFILVMILSVSCCSRYLSINNFNSNDADPFNNIKNSVFFVLRTDSIDIDLQDRSETLVVAESSGTGTAVRSNRNFTDVLTAGHVCVDYFADPLSSSNVDHMYELLDFHGNHHKADLIAVDVESDLCLLRIWVPSETVDINHGKTLSGAHVRYSGYPLGLYIPGNLHHFEGRYSGTDRSGYSMFSLPAVGGSSGSAILNNDGEIIGVISAVTGEFANLTIGPGTERINAFLFLSSDCQKYCI